MEIILLIAGLTGLWIGAELTIRAALHIADHFKISQLFIGLTIMTIGTDLPEMFIDVTAAIQRLKGIETSGIIIGETIGTLFSQITLILGIAGVFGVLSIKKRMLMRDGFMLLATVLLLFLAGYDGEISRLDGLIFILIYAGYFFTLFREEKVFEKIKRAPSLFFGWSILSLVSGLIILTAASKVTIDNALLISENLGIPQQLIGILLVGLGTSLPELATVLPALRKGAGKMIVGNLLGSNIFDILITLGVSATISGFLVDENLLKYDIPLLFLVSLLVIFFFITKKRLIKKEALILIGIYLGYFSLKFSDLLTFL